MMRKGNRFGYQIGKLLLSLHVIKNISFGHLVLSLPNYEMREKLN